MAHAAVCGVAVCDHIEPVDAPVSQADTGGPERLGNDGVAGVVARDDPGFAEVRHAREAAALLVDGGADVHGSLELDSRPPQRLDREDRRGDPRLHVRRAPPVDAPPAHQARERVDRPAVTRRHHVEVAVQVEPRASRNGRSPPHDVHPRVCGGVLGASLGLHVLHREARLLQPPSDQLRAVAVARSRGIHRGDADHLRREGHDFVARGLHFGEDAVFRASAGRRVCGLHVDRWAGSWRRCAAVRGAWNAREPGCPGT